MLPTLAKIYDAELDFDALGITVCSIAGINFGPYVRLLGPKGLDIPFTVLTDFDPKGEEVSQEDADPDDGGVVDSYGKNRVVNQIMRHLLATKLWDRLSFDAVLARAPKNGVFMNTFTFEIDVFKAGAQIEFAEAIRDLTTNGRCMIALTRCQRIPAHSSRRSSSRISNRSERVALHSG
jgi:putative ATP-dependent endonuclease of the OLD family